MSIKTILTTVGTKIKVHSPAILLVTGIVAVVGGTVAACVATTKLEPVVDKAKEDLDLIRDREAEGALKEGEAPKLKTQCYLRTAAKVTYLYSIPAAMIIGGLTCISVSHHIMSKRIGGLTIALNSMTAMNNRLKRNIVAKYGQQEYHNLATKRYDISPDQKEEAEKTDALVKAERDCPWISEMDRCFDEGNPNWRKNAYENEAFLACQQNYINDKIRSRRSEKLLKNGVLEVHPGYILAMEVDNILGWNRPEDVRKSSSMIGKMTDGACDPNQPDYFDLGIFEQDEKGSIHLIIEDRNVWLHPNYDGVISDKIGVPLYFKDGVRCDKHGNPI